MTNDSGIAPGRARFLEHQERHKQENQLAISAYLDKRMDPPVARLVCGEACQLADLCELVEGTFVVRGAFELVDGMVSTRHSDFGIDDFSETQCENMAIVRTGIDLHCPHLTDLFLCRNSVRRLALRGGLISIGQPEGCDFIESEFSEGTWHITKDCCTRPRIWIERAKEDRQAAVHSNSVLT